MWEALPDFFDSESDGHEFKMGKTKDSDSGKDSDSSSVAEEYEDAEDFEEEEEEEEEEEHRWNYLHTIEEEDEEEEEKEETYEDSGNDSELETFEMLEQMCEEECKEKRGRIVSYHEYKKVKETSQNEEDYENLLVVENQKIRLKDSKNGGNEDLEGLELLGVDLINTSSVLTGGGYMKHEAPDSKIKSALKRASSKKRKKHKVQFDESLNKFFDADYVILIREECGGGGCECGGGGGGFCYAEDDDEEDDEVRSLDLTPFEPPTEFVDTLTLSPPDGYKDYSLTDEGREEEREWRPEPPKCEDGTTQTTPTSENEQENDEVQKKERYIVETITMTTVTERRIIQEGEGSSTSLPKEKDLLFKLNSNSLKPNSALRQLFPRIASPPPDKSPDSDDDSLQSNLIKRTIERNTLRRSLVRYPDLKKRNQAKKNENSLVERIKKLTCDIDEEETRSSPTGEESDKLPAYRKITDIFIRNKDLQPPPVEHQYPYYPPDLGNGPKRESRKQFLLAPLTACVSTPGSRDSTSTVDTEYSLNDIDDVLEQKPQPDIVVGTPGNESELALFVQQDASRLERLRKRYNSSSDDEHDDYGFNRRPSVRGIKPRFGSTTEILQQMQQQIPPSHISWPYYGYQRYEEPNNVIVQQNRGTYQAPVQVHLMAAPRQVVVRGTQTISTYYQIPRYPRPLLYYPRSPACGSPTKVKLERGVPEGASASPHPEMIQPQGSEPMMYAMNV